jgi:hypothetical protein
MRQPAKPATAAYPNPESIPCGSNPEIRRLIANAAPCRCGSRNLMPMSNAQIPPAFAVACKDCGVLKGVASDLARAIAIWSAWATSTGDIAF